MGQNLADAPLCKLITAEWPGVVQRAALLRPGPGQGHTADMTASGCLRTWVPSVTCKVDAHPR
jgi:hypothetical protein